jgi:hypothetical protein
MAPNWTQSAQWIWTPGYHEEDNQPGRYFLFRKRFQWPGTVNIKELPVHVSADSRYRLFVNGQRVSFGPCKSYMERWHFETVDILPYLVKGENVLSARVLRYSSITAGSSSILSTELPGFLLHCEIEVRHDITLALDRHQDILLTNILSRIFRFLQIQHGNAWRKLRDRLFPTPSGIISWVLLFFQTMKERQNRHS